MDSSKGLLRDKVAVVTGAGNGIGRAVAIGMARAGARVVVNDLGVQLDGGGSSPKAAQATVDEIVRAGGTAVPSFETVATLDGGRRIVEAALDTWGRIDALVCVAGVLRPGRIGELSEEDWDLVMDVNAKGHFTTMRAAVPHMLRQKAGSITCFTSGGGLEGAPLQPNYGASKEAIVGLMRSVALAAAPHVTCNAVWPMAATRMTQRMAQGLAIGTAEQVSPLVEFLASDRARHVTGQVIAVCGNRISLYPQPRPVRTIFSVEDWTARSLAQVWDAQLGVDQLVRWDRFVQQEGR
jgi:NAD(P)-dependent dehydrogenase (short-subunit alcohol dehydrogenase family)